MRRAKRAHGRILTAGVVCFTLMLPWYGPASAGEVSWQKYMNSVAVVSAIASAIAMVEPCSEPLVFHEDQEEGKLTLSVSCQGNEDEEAAAIIEFHHGDDGVIIPS